MKFTGKNNFLQNAKALQQKIIEINVNKTLNDLKDILVKK